MNQLNNLQHKFPVEDSIPESVRLPSQIHQRVSLVDGELRLGLVQPRKHYLQSDSAA